MATHRTLTYVGTHEDPRGPRARARRLRRSLCRRVGDGLLGALAVVGAVSVAATLAGHLLGYHLVMFATGSMAPTIPTGSLALSHTTPAAQLQVGQVVTIDRAQVLPITHRIVAIEQSPASGADRVLRTRGDANLGDDPTLREVSQADVVLASVPGGARWVTELMRARTRLVLTVVVSALVLWAFWPRRRGERR